MQNMTLIYLQLMKFAIEFIIQCKLIKIKL